MLVWLVVEAGSGALEVLPSERHVAKVTSREKVKRQSHGACATDNHAGGAAL